jgi:hypothetical protein
MSVSATAKETIGRLISTALSGDVNTAVAVLQQSGLNEGQKTKIADILQEPRADNKEQTIAAMQQRIVTVVGEGNIASVATPNEQPSSTQVSQVITSDQIGLPSDIMELLLNRYFSTCEFKTLSAVASVNKHWNSCSTNFWENRDLNDIQKLCPGLRILDAKAQGVSCEDEPKISIRRLLKEVSELSPHVEGDAGVTQLTMTKGTTLNQLVEIAKGLGMTVDLSWGSIKPTLGDVPVEQTYGILITNNVFLQSRNKPFKNLVERDKAFNIKETLVKGHRCEMPTVQEYVALWIYTNKVFSKCLYGPSPATYGWSSTHIENYPLVVGGSTPKRLNIDSMRFSFAFGGAGGKRKI